MATWHRKITQARGHRSGISALWPGFFPFCPGPQNPSTARSKVFYPSEVIKINPRAEQKGHRPCRKTALPSPQDSTQVRTRKRIYFFRQTFFSDMT